MSSQGEGSSELQLGIGAVSKATGIPTETLRTWERRYRFPNPERTAAGHRTYSAATVERLRWIAKSIEAGHRPAQVVELPVDTLKALVGATSPEAAKATSAPRSNAAKNTDRAFRSQSRSAGHPATNPHLTNGANARPRPTVVGEPPAEGGGDAFARRIRPTSESQADSAPISAQQRVVEEWLSAVSRFDESGLDRGLRMEWARLGTLRFLTDRAGPFMEAVGNYWIDGRFNVSHEHFASERMRDFLAGIWRPLAEYNTGPLILCATLPNEQHQIGLHMAACVVALAGCRVLFLGVGAPTRDISEAAVQAEANSVVVSVSSATDSGSARHNLQSLRNALPPDIEIVVGGAGAPRNVPETTWPGGLLSLWDWLRHINPDENA